MPASHTPTRRCLGCGRHAAKTALARFVAAPDGGARRLVRDDRGKVPGRGLYVCPTRACFEAATMRKAFDRGARLRGETLLVDGRLADALD